MLYQVLGVRASELNWSVIQNLVAVSKPEDQYLDFKRDLNGQTFAKTVAGMANAGGGLVILGIDDGKREAATSIHPLSVEGVRTQVQQALAERVEPWMRPSYYPVYEGEEGSGVLVVEVPLSENAPFAVKDKASEGGARLFYERVERESKLMRERDIERAYRDRFYRRDEVATRVAALRAKVEAHAELHNQLPSPIYIAAVPLEVPARAVLPLSREREQELRNIVAGSEAGHVSHRAQSRVGFQRIEFDEGPGTRPQHGWTAIGNDGSWLDVLVPEPQTLDSTGYLYKGGYLWDWGIVEWGIASLTRLEKLCGDMGITGELIVAAGVIRTEMRTMLLPSDAMGQWTRYAQQWVTESGQVEVSTITDELRSLTARLVTLKMLLDAMFSAFGWRECGHIGTDGSLSLRGARRDVMEWAAEHGVVMRE